MAQEYKPGQIVPQSGIYTIAHDPAHADMPHEVGALLLAYYDPDGWGLCRPCRHRHQRRIDGTRVVLISPKGLGVFREQFGAKLE